jgi:hypothetical protein
MKLIIYYDNSMKIHSGFQIFYAMTSHSDHFINKSYNKLLVSKNILYGVIPIQNSMEHRDDLSPLLSVSL